LALRDGEVIAVRIAMSAAVNSRISLILMSWTFLHLESRIYEDASISWTPAIGYQQLKGSDCEENNHFTRTTFAT
jgi:hypothetical protein